MLVSPYIDGIKLKVGIVNDRLEEVNAQLRLKLMDFDGKVIWEEASIVELPANSSNDYFDENKNEFLYRKDTRNLLFSAELVENGNVISKNVFFFRPYKELKVPKPKVEFSIAKADAGFNIELKTDKLAKNVYLQASGDNGFFSDNYFDMLPGEKTVIHYNTELNENDFKDALTVRTLDDAF